MISKPVILGTAFLAMSGHALAATLPYKTYASASRCKITSMSSASGESVQAAAFIAAQVSATLCKPDDKIADSATATAEATADAFATALVSATANCYASGTSTFSVNGESLAAAEAVAIAEAYAEAQASSKTCGKCHVAGEAIAASFKEIYLKATAGIEFVFNGIADGTEINTVFSVVSESIQEATVTAFAEAIATARAADDKCTAGAEANTAAGVPGDLSSTTSCKVNLVAAADEVVSNALVDVAAEAATKICGGLATGSASFEVEGSAVAKAMARAMTEISSSCYTKGKGYGCAAGEAEIKKTATAVATIFADGFATAASKCYKGCQADSASMAKVIGEILATATSKTMDDQCTGPKPHFTLEKSELVIATATAKAIAKVIVTSSVDAFGGCEAVAVTEAGLGPIDSKTTKIPGGKLPTKEPSYPAYSPVYPTVPPAYAAPVKPTPVPAKPTPAKPAPTKPAPTKPAPARKQKPVQRRRKPSKGGRKVSKKGRKGGKKVVKRGRKVGRSFGFKGRKGGKKVVKRGKKGPKAVRRVPRKVRKVARRGRKMLFTDEI